MKNKLSAVALFHETFGMGVSSAMRADLGVDKNLLRFNLMDEENKELKRFLMKSKEVI